ncbi:alpha/beta fold hydrolase [Paraburkholderia flagellata]|uniref:alpha/beta fold hydrolase n=1 Tax=Paraburkholderia flagellata TaxID=2883241 RepID=UPI001F249A47|nr:alpha/beta hydrolase [Paraburkholderia flagellata]
MISTLFLHGPGLSSIAERELYGQTLPIHWWDQPRSVVLFVHPFSALVDAAEDELRALSSASGRPVDLVAHSFGAHVVLRLISRVPENIGRVWLIAPVYDIGGALVRLATRLLEHSPSLAQLLAALQDFMARSDYSRFARLAAQITSLANFFDVYWSARANTRRIWYLNLLARHGIVDTSVFEVILRDLWTETPAFQPPPAVGPGHDPVRLVFGREDPLIDIETERAAWIKLFPFAQCIEIPAGHFVHLEAPASDWWHAP